jgi:lactoylglutathione lyase
MNHLCLEVDNLDRVVDELGNRGVSLVREKKLGLDRNLQAWIEDPDGNRIELMQMAADSMQSEAIARLRTA